MHVILHCESALIILNSYNNRTLCCHLTMNVITKNQMLIFSTVNGANRTESSLSAMYDKGRKFCQDLSVDS